MRISTPANTPAPAPSALASLTSLDMDRDGRLTVSDAHAFETSGDAWRGQQARIAAALVTGDIPTDPSATVAGLLGSSMRAGRQGAFDVARGVSELDLGALRRTGARTVATFDFDNTLASGDVLAPVVARLGARGLLDADDPAFREVRVRHGIGSVDPAAPVDANADAEAVMHAILAAGPAVDRELVTAAFFATTSALRGTSTAAAAAVAREVLRDGAPELGVAPLRDRLIDASAGDGDAVLDLWSASARAGMEPWLVTFGFEWIAREAADLVGIPRDRVVGWGAETRDGHFTGSSPRDGDKASMIRSRIGAVPLFAAGDSGSDLPMLDLAVARSLVVNPTRSMLAADQARGGRFALVDYALPRLTPST